MRLLFVVDKPQTFQIIDSMLFEAAKSHDVFVHAYFDVSPFIPSGVHGKVFSHLQQMVDFSVNNHKNFDVIFAINHFNPGWQRLHALQKCVGLEYCWNEIYNIHRQKKVMPGTLYTNTSSTMNYLRSVLPEQPLRSLGSPWFQAVHNRRSTEKKSQITVLAPHNNFLAADKQSNGQVLKFIEGLKSYTSETGRSLVLRDRRKFHNNLRDRVKFDDVVYDDKPFSHVSLYSESEAVVHFCSSAVCELAFCETPSVSLFGDVHRKLHQSSVLKPAVDYVNSQFFNSDIGDEVHAINFERSQIPDVTTAIDKIDHMIATEKDWRAYQMQQFPGDHQNAASNIITNAVTNA